MYVEFIKEQLLPELQHLTTKYSVWWTFKPDSTLKSYIERHHYKLNDYFIPDELLNILLDIIDSNYMAVEGNSALIIPDKFMKKCFSSWMLLKKDLAFHCLEHIDVVEENISKNLQNKHIAMNLCVNSPIELLYNDRTSKFWVHPILNFHLNQNKDVAYSWTELHFMFLDFCTTNVEHFTRVNETIIAINSQSEISKLFQFKYFHLDQIDDLLKHATYFLGRTNKLQKLWRYKTFNIMSEEEINQICTFVDDVINNNHNLSGQIYFSCINL